MRTILLFSLNIYIEKEKNMKYLRLFNHHEEYLEYIASEEFVSVKYFHFDMKIL